MVKETKANQLFFEMLGCAERFKRVRMLNQNHSEDMERLLSSMEFNLHLSKNEQSLLLEKVDDVDCIVECLAETQVETEESLSWLKESTFRSFNLLRIISEVGARFEIKDDLSLIEARRKLSFDDLAKYVPPPPLPLETSIKSLNPESLSARQLV
jgi:hypothetical protein